VTSEIDAEEQALCDTLTVTEQAGERVDVIVARAAKVPRSGVAAAAEAGHLLLNDQICKGSARAAAGDRITYRIGLVAPLAILPQEIPLTILHEDEALLVVEKPAGMVTHPAHGTPDGTLVNALLAHVARLPGEPVRAGLVHRLDRDTSGLLVVAKTDEALSYLGRAMERRLITREYIGLVVGLPEDAAGTLDGPLARDPEHRLLYAVRSEGKPAITHFRLTEALRGASEMAFRLETGRTHQIRVHMSAYGHPLVNDPLYGRRDRRSPLPGQALHAQRLTFRHPTTREILTFEAPPPPAYLATKALFGQSPP